MKMLDPIQSRRGRLIAAMTLASALAVGGCSRWVQGRPKADWTQGWSPSEQHDWYRGSQGSRLIPASWLLALEDAQTQAKLMRPDNVMRWGYLPAPDGDGSPYPIGFAEDITAVGELSLTSPRWYAGQGEKEKWIGLNCAACHTAKIDYRGHSIRVDGGPTIADFQGFIRALNQSLEATATDNAKFERFAADVLKDRPAAHRVGDTKMLRDALATLVARQKALAELNAESGFANPSKPFVPVDDYGYARLDAVGHILNKVAYLMDAKGQFGGRADAPVSYPFIWNVNQHDFVQWNGIAPNKGVHLPSGETFDIGAIVRNTSEVVGVFADVKVTKPATLGGYHSSVNARNLDAMEAQLSRLQSPAWPVALFGPINKRLRDDGEKLFVTKCQGCHAPLAPDDTHTKIVAQMTPIWGGAKPVGTDPWMACNAFNYQALTGTLDGGRKAYLVGSETFGTRAFTHELLVATSVGTLFGKKRQLLDTAVRAAFGLPRKIEVVGAATPQTGQLSDAERLRDCRAHSGDVLMRYKARPLNGIWATAPYLHNGSVKSLYELLLPQAERSPQFWVGNREYDPDNVGYRDERTNYSSLLDTSKKGNSNAGHDYGNANLSKDQRSALVEYMKGL
jgi:mono/diheme cytochrome c family protein